MQQVAGYGLRDTMLLCYNDAEIIIRYLGK